MRLDPRAAEAHSNLGLILLERGEPEEALGHCREAIRLRPNFLTARINLGNVLQVLGRLDEAEECFRELIRLGPNLAAAHAGLAGVREELGDSEGSLESLREALRHDPRHAGALARLATRLREELSAADQAAIERLTAEPGLPAAGRWAMLFGLAHVFDARAEFARAADSAAGANAMQQADFRRRGLAYDSTEHKLFVDRLLEAFTPEFFERVRGWGLETERPVFVVGMPRSGTTLVEQILASHRRVFGAGELQLARNAFRALPEVTGRGGLPHECLEHLDRDALGYLAREHLERLAARNASADRVVDKMPENTLYLGLMAALFPRAKFIHCRRDLRDVALSCWMTNFDQAPLGVRSAPHRLACGPNTTGSWITGAGCCRSRCFEVDYESIVAEPGDCVAGACGLVRARVGPGMPRVSQNAACRSDRERSPGAPADLQQLDRSLEELRAGACRAVRRARERRVSAEWGSSGARPRFRFGLVSDADGPCSRFGFVLCFGMRGENAVSRPGDGQHRAVGHGLGQLIAIKLLRLPQQPGPVD